MDSIWKELSSHLDKEYDGISLVQTSEAGRGIVALKDFEKEEVILEESPFVVGPPQSIGPHFCANCSQPLTIGVLTDCLNACGLKICSEKCQMEHKRHDAEECDLVKKIEDKNPEKWLTVLRILRIRKSKPDLWSKFLMLEDHLGDRMECPLMKANKASVQDVLKRHVPELMEGLSIGDIMRICGILDANSFRFDKNGTRGLFVSASMINHDCLPNARVVFRRDGHMVVKAKKAISKGDPVTITYCTLLTNAETRLKKMKASKFFTCRCDLCLDVSEKKTFMSALICPKCKGHLLPDSFHNNNPTWRCDKCEFATTQEKVNKLVDVIKNNFDSIVSNPRIFPAEKAAELESILKKRCGTVLASTHQLMLDVKLELLNLYDTNPKLEGGSVSKRLEFIRERIDLIKMLEGKDTDSRLKGFLLFRLHNLLVAKVALLQRKNALTEKDLKEIGAELGICLTESARILLEDQGCPPQLRQTVATFSNGRL